MTIAILGGTFDPPHFGHLLVARQVLEYVTDVDEVWLLPDNTNPFKTVTASAKDRLAMTKLLEEPGILVSDADVKRGGETYTIDSVRNLQKDAKNTYQWIIGSDLLSQLPRWKNYNELVSLVSFIVFPRTGFPVAKSEQKITLLPENTVLTSNYSATAIRARVAKGLSIKGLVPDAVAKYINKHKLYTSNV